MLNTQYHRVCFAIQHKYVNYTIPVCYRIQHKYVKYTIPQCAMEFNINMLNTQSHNVL